MKAKKGTKVFRPPPKKKSKQLTHPPDVVQLALVRDLAAAGLGDLEDCFFDGFVLVQTRSGFFSSSSAVSLSSHADRGFFFLA